MSIQSLSLPVFWVSCDSCGAQSTPIHDAHFDDTLAVELAMVKGWSTDGHLHHCTECPPVMEVCS